MVRKLKKRARKQLFLNVRKRDPMINIIKLSKIKVINLTKILKLFTVIN